MESNIEDIGLTLKASFQVKTLLRRSSIISMFLINEGVLKESLYSAFVKWFAFRTIDLAKSGGKTQAVLSRFHMAERIEKVLLECGFIPDNNTLIRVIIPTIAKREDFEKIIHSIDYMKNNPCIANNSLWNSRFEIALEKMFWPVKLSPSSIPCFIVPITAEYAMELFDEMLSTENPCLFDNEKIMPALSTQKAYFKGKKQSIKKSPAHILWYISISKELIGTGMIRACSILDSTEIGNRKHLFRKYQRFGVIDWQKLQSFGDTEEDISAYSFSYTELFRRPISLSEIKTILGRPKETFQSYREITHDEFLKIYKLGAYNE